MKKTPFILHEKFRSDNNEQRKERFQKEFERYIIDGCVMLRMDARVQKEGGRS